MSLTPAPPCCFKRIIAGGAIRRGTLVAFLAFIPAYPGMIDLSKHLNLPAAYNDSPLPAVVTFGALAVVLLLVGTGHIFKDQNTKPAADQNELG